MEFLASPVWWGLVVAASIVFALWFRWGARPKGGNVQQLGRIGYFSLAALAFMFNDWPGGVAICIVSGVVGQFLPGVVNQLWIKPVSELPTRTLSTPRPVEPLGRRAILRDMIQNGVSRGKVRILLQQGKLVAYEDPNTGLISLIRPEDLAAVQSLRSRDDSGAEEQN